MLNELRDTVPLVMKCEGVDAENSRPKPNG